MTTEMHAVFATAYDSKTYRVSDPLAWDEAQRAWAKLDALHRERRMPHVKFFEVRTVFVGPDRPLVGPEITSHGRYDGARLDMFYATPVDGTRGFGSDEAAARAAWKRAFGDRFHRRAGAGRERESDKHGSPTVVQGRGGWFYYRNGTPVAQGLRDLARVVKSKRMIVQGGDGRWYVAAPEEVA